MHATWYCVCVCACMRTHVHVYIRVWADPNLRTYQGNNGSIIPNNVFSAAHIDSTINSRAEVTDCQYRNKVVPHTETVQEKIQEKIQLKSHIKSGPPHETNFSRSKCATLLFISNSIKRLTTGLCNKVLQGFTVQLSFNVVPPPRPSRLW